MDNYTESQRMFSDKFYEIIVKYQLDIPEIVFDYFAQLSKEDLQKIEEKILKYDSMAGSVGKLRITAEISRFKTEAQTWKKRQESSEVLDEPKENIDLEEEIELIENNNTQEKSVIIRKKLGDNLSPTQRQEITNIPITDINDVKIHDNYQLDLFALQFPIFALKLDRKQLTHRFTNRQNVEITLRANELGRATVQDADLWLYCITKMMQLIFEENRPNRRITFTGADFLKATGRKGGGGNYEQIIRSLERLEGTTLRTNQTIGIFQKGTGHGLIDSFAYLYNTENKKIGIEVVLPEWLFNEIMEKKIVRINPQYLKLKPLEKRIYHLAKYHCRHQQKSSRFELDYFAKKLGSTNGNLYDFKKNLKKIEKCQPLPEYLIHLDQDKNQVYFTHRTIKNISGQQIANDQIKEVQRKVTSKRQREEIEAFEAGNFFPISNEEAIKNILNFVEKNYPEKKYPIFKTEILSEQKLSEYLQKFDGNYLLSKIREFIDYDFTQCKNPEGYFFSALQKGMEQ